MVSIHAPMRGEIQESSRIGSRIVGVRPWRLATLAQRGDHEAVAEAFRLVQSGDLSSRYTLQFKKVLDIVIDPRHPLHQLNSEDDLQRLLDTIR